VEKQKKLEQGGLNCSEEPPPPHRVRISRHFLRGVAHFGKHKKQREKAYNIEQGLYRRSIFNWIKSIAQTCSSFCRSHCFHCVFFAAAKSFIMCARMHFYFMCMRMLFCIGHIITPADPDTFGMHSRRISQPASCLR
jgi:hypothetical protein